MKYLHLHHAGNFADVHKHVALVAVLAALARKPRPLFYLETHAGRGDYDLGQQGGGEAQQGIVRLLAATGALPAPLPQYLDLVRAHGTGPTGRLRHYPGSPLIAARLLRDGDRAALCELQPAECDALRANCSRDPRFAVHARDGWEALGALLPPPEVRGLALIDPPYEAQEDELERLGAALATAAARWPQGVLMAWYPLKQGLAAARFHRRLQDAGLRRLLAAELAVHPLDSRAGLNGSGLLFVNPPWRLDATLAAVQPALHAALAVDGRGGHALKVLAGE